MEKEPNAVGVENDIESVSAGKNQSENKQSKEKNPFKVFTRQRTRFIAFTALFAAISILLKMQTIPFGTGGSLKLTFTYIPAFLAGALFGPASGFLVGLVSDIIGFFVSGGRGWPNPVVTLTSGLLGLIPGLVFWLFRRFRGRNVNVIFPTVISFLLVLLICTNLNTMALYVFDLGGAKGRHNTFWAYVIYRTPAQAVIVSINFIIATIIIGPIDSLAKRIFK